MRECYYVFTFDLEDPWITEETLRETELSLHEVGLESPVHFDDFIDSWKATCVPIFEDAEDAERLSSRFFLEEYKRGGRQISIELEHNPLKNTHAVKYTRVRVQLFENEETKHVSATVMWEQNPELEKRVAERETFQSM